MEVGDACEKTKLLVASEAITEAEAALSIPVAAQVIEGAAEFAFKDASILVKGGAGDQIDRTTNGVCRKVRRIRLHHLDACQHVGGERIQRNVAIAIDVGHAQAVDGDGVVLRCQPSNGGGALDASTGLHR